MAKRFVAIWFRYLKTDWFVRREKTLSTIPFVLTIPDHGRMLITAANQLAEQDGIYKGMVVADARVIIPSLKVLDDLPGLPEKLLKGLGEWCIRFTPVVAIDLPDGLLLDVSGCAHLWGGEKLYLQHIIDRLWSLGYHVRASMADTIGAAWAFARYGSSPTIIESNKQAIALLALPPESLRLESETFERLHTLGLRNIQHFINIPRSVLRRRFGEAFIQRLNQALGFEEEMIIPVQPIAVYCERLTCLEPITTLTGIEIALQQLLETLCNKLKKEQKGLRTACFKCYRIDGKTETVEIGTNRATTNTQHLFKLFELKLSTIEPAFGIELFTLEAKKTEDVCSSQITLWQHPAGLKDAGIAELMDRIAGKLGAHTIQRYLPAEHYWPERSFKSAQHLLEANTTTWKVDRPRPLQLLPSPSPIEVTAPVPDYPPMMFRYKGTLHKVIKADGPERIEQEWWLQQGQHRDYYYVEDETGCRYWIFRSGHYTDESYQWFLHGFFA
ncbi:DNA polymerase Y family protein [Lacibacter sp. H375]|uniref:Y-family DNA polymerase n=1 Tax=Lacibacter sp. H375 TaxID=3133424 RepID=UPI0030C48E0F